jgi:hypothetical protein
MDEVFPVLSGIVIGLATYFVRRLWLRVALIGVFGFGLGAIASWVSGEITLSCAYVLIDAAQVIVASIITGALVSVWLRRRARSLAQ